MYFKVAGNWFRFICKKWRIITDINTIFKKAKTYAFYNYPGISFTSVRSFM
jgi:hypothetical protein